MNKTYFCLQGHVCLAFHKLSKADEAAGITETAVFTVKTETVDRLIALLKSSYASEAVLVLGNIIYKKEELRDYVIGEGVVGLIIDLIEKKSKVI